MRDGVGRKLTGEWTHVERYRWLLHWRQGGALG
jgi:hypothetical protein